MADWISIPPLLAARWTIGGGFGLCLVVGALVFPPADGDHSVSQPIAFNHAKHLANGMSCTDCHTGVETQASATLPALDICMNCHATALTGGAEERKVRDLAGAGKELAWVRLTQVPAHVFFSHRRHVALAKIACAVCHGPMEKATAPPARPFRLFTMDACIQCHENNRGGTECNDCHR